MNFWEGVLAEVQTGLPEAGTLGRLLVRLTAALVLTGIIGWEREVGNKTAGLRTHLLVALGSCLFVMAALEGGASEDATTRVAQGIATGIGFIGAGAIVKYGSHHRVRGLTTAGSIWMAAGIGVACGYGRYGLAAIAVLTTWVVLVPLEIVKEKYGRRRLEDEAKPEPS